MKIVEMKNANFQEKMPNFEKQEVCSNAWPQHRQCGGRVHGASASASDDLLVVPKFGQSGAPQPSKSAVIVWAQCHTKYLET